MIPFEPYSDECLNDALFKDFTYKQLAEMPYQKRLEVWIKFNLIRLYHADKNAYHYLMQQSLPFHMRDIITRHVIHSEHRAEIARQKNRGYQTIAQLLHAAFKRINLYLIKEKNK